MQELMTELITEPTTIIIFGITGDLAQKKIIPAIYDLYATGRLPEKIKIVGFSRREFSDEDLRQYVAGLLPKGFDTSFLNIFTYVSGQFDDPDSYKKLATHLSVVDEVHGGCSNKLFYLSVPPTLYENILQNISLSGLSIPCGGELGWARVLIEKPFGNNLRTAEHLDSLLGKLFKEEQIFRIDHYLAKESLMNILNRRKSDEVLSAKWNKDYIKKVEINLFETAAVGSRGAFYDGLGALCDVGQNHMLQMLALIAMDVPKEMNAITIARARADVLNSLVPASPAEIKEMVRGQYEGYLDEPGVREDSLTETFFSLTSHVGTKHFSGVPFVLTGGKALSIDLTEIKVTFTDDSEIVFSVPKSESLPAYQKILLDCIAGDQRVFISTDEILGQWSYVEPIALSWQKVPLIIYKKGSDRQDILSKKNTV